MYTAQRADDAREPGADIYLYIYTDTYRLIDVHRTTCTRGGRRWGIRYG